MPCDSVAVVRARLEVDAAAEILGAPEAVDALVRWLRRESGACAVLSAAADEVRPAGGASAAPLAGRLNRDEGFRTAGDGDPDGAPPPGRRGRAGAPRRPRTLRCLSPARGRPLPGGRPGRRCAAPPGLTRWSPTSRAGSRARSWSTAACSTTPR